MSPCAHLDDLILFPLLLEPLFSLLCSFSPLHGSFSLPSSLPQILLDGDDFSRLPIPTSQLEEFQSIVPQIRYAIGQRLQHVSS